MFLKRFEARGFKSFADPVTINFYDGMVGIVGPNGVGKSNIVDGLKWVLGEKSLKQLRGRESADFIFSGSDDREPANFAEITLTFVNANQYLRTKYEELSVTRRLTKGVSKNEYFINGELSSLGAIKEIFVDSGLNKGSLGIISQGTVSWFTEAKAIERRRIFEDAAEIGKYTAEKLQTKKQLENTKIQLQHAFTKFEEIQKTINRLSKQAEQAKFYLEKKEQLKKLEVSLFTKQILKTQSMLDDLNQELNSKQAVVNDDDQNINDLNHQLKFAKSKHDEIDQLFFSDNELLSEYQQQYNQLKNKINLLEQELQNQLASDQIEVKMGALQQALANKTAEKDQLKVKIDSLATANQASEGAINSLKLKHQQLNQEFEQYNFKVSKLQHMLEDLVNKLADRYRHDYGLKAILSAKASLPGIYDVLENVINVAPEYQLAITNALGRARKNILVRNSDDAKNAIEFLKQNKQGQATFLPIKDLNYRPFSEDHYSLLVNTEGFVGMANELVECDGKYQPAIDMLLNKVIISEDLDAAFKHAKFTQNYYRIYTLDGQYLAPSGAITGGYFKQRPDQAINLEQAKQNLETQLQELKHHRDQVALQANVINAQISDSHTKLQPNIVELAKMEGEYNRLVDLVHSYELELQKYAHYQNPELKNQEMEQLYADMVSIEARLNEQKNLVNTNNQIRLRYKNEVDQLQIKLSQLNQNLQDQTNALHKLSLKKQRAEIHLANYQDQLAQKYEMTVEFALSNYQQDLGMSDSEAESLITDLNQELGKMKNVNLDAAIELQALEEEFETKQSKYEQVKQACADLEQAIELLDAKATANFNHIINSVNEKLPAIFQYLFGGGGCQIVCDQPENVLESGIEIHVQLPGKNVANMMLFSGGEKTLIALSVLFTILQVSQLPLVILDEAESALDLTNVERFANMIKQHCEKTQFITITHRSGTMEKCDYLYGVTMVHKGVSQVLHMKMADAKALVEEQQNG